MVNVWLTTSFDLAHLSFLEMRCSILYRKGNDLAFHPYA